MTNASSAASGLMCSTASLVLASARGRSSPIPPMEMSRARTRCGLSTQPETTGKSVGLNDDGMRMARRRSPPRR